MYRVGSQIVGEVLGQIEEIGAKWQRKAQEGARKYQVWAEVFKNSVDPFVQSRVGQTLDRAGMEALINAIKEAKRNYAGKRR